MDIFVNPDNSAFVSTLNARIYVDKSELIKYTNSVFASTDAYICNSRPHRFGKSITANMLAAYYSKGCDSFDIFSDLEISKDNSFKAYLNKYDVIHLDIQWCLLQSKGNLIDYITKRVIFELKEYCGDILGDGDFSISEALALINSKTGNKFVIIIDEWDVLIRDNGTDKKALESYINFLRSLFKGIEPSKYIGLAYITGILPMIKEKTQSALNNFDEFTMLSPGCLAKYTGFIEEEVKCLANKYNKDFEKIKRWYDGYLLKDYEVYNPKAVTSVILKDEYKSYWSETASYKTIVPLINMNYDGLKNAIIEMLSGGSVSVNISTFNNDVSSISSKDEVLTYLIHLGYLAYDQNKKMAYVPNEEIRQELNNAVASKKWNEMLKFSEESNKLLKATLDMNEEEVAKRIEVIHDEYVSSIKYNDENSLSSVIRIAYLSSMEYYFKPLREFKSGKGFCDYVYLPKKEYQDDYPALIVELKWDKSTNGAIKQIHDKQYPLSIKEYTNNILLVGINYDSNNKKHSCKIEKLAM